MRNRWMVPFLVLLLALGLAACGDDDDDGDTSAGDTPTTESKDDSGDDEGKGGDAEGNVTVTMTDHAFEVSGEMTEGGTITVKNEGDEVHMIGFGKFKAGADLAKLREALAKADPEAQEDPTAELFEAEIGWPGNVVTPGHEVTVSAANLAVGTYGVICFFPTEGGGPPHFAKGMVGEFEVVEGEADTESDADANVYTVTKGQAIKGPATLEAGEQAITLKGTDIGDHEPQLVKAESADQTPEELDKILEEQFASFESEEGPPKGAGKDIADYVIFFGFDLGDDLDEVTFTFDFEPGTYYLAADASSEEAEGPPKELIKITVE